MKTKLFGATLLCLLMADCKFDQPALGCPVGRLNWYVKYTLVDGVGACAEKKGDVWGVYKYNPATADGQNFDSSQATLVAQPNALATVAYSAFAEGRPDPDPSHSAIASGSFPTRPGTDGFCAATTLSLAQQSIAALPPMPLEDGGMSEPLPAAAISYSMTDLRLTTSARAPGTQMTGKLEYTEDGCVAHYDVVGVWPAVSCADSNGMPDVSLCVPGGMSPDFPVVCDPDTMMCALDGAPPALLSQ
jgi:hypothetical protein